MSGSRRGAAARKRASVRPLLLVALAAGLLLAAPAAADARDVSGGGAERLEADAALEGALALLAPAKGRMLFGESVRPDGRETTLLLRDLAAGLDELSPERRALAERILARPTDRTDSIKPYRSKARHVCDARVCVWWVTKGADAPPLADRNRNRIPDWVERTRAVFRKVWATEVGSYGYRRPLSDLSSKNHGPNGKLDVYLADVGGRGIYGYCTSDDPRRSRSLTVSSYCVVDDDFSRTQFRGGAVGRKALEVTAAHEFFHAVQFAYDWLEDRWLMEGTASWIEDEVYPAINDNLQYLRASPIGRDLFWLPLDIWEPAHSKPESGFIYGTWIFWRYLDERFGRPVVRDVWNRARGGTFAVDAVNGALAARGETFRSVFAGFGAANLSPATSYVEGALYASRPNVGPLPSATFQLTAATPTVSPAPIPMPHMSNDYYALVPGGLPPTATLAVEVALPGSGGAANLLVRRTDGSVATVPIPLTAGGIGSVAGIEFGSGAVSSATLVLTNAGTRFASCNEDLAPPFFSCGGFSLDDAEYTIRATATP